MKLLRLSPARPILAALTVLFSCVGAASALATPGAQRAAEPSVTVSAGTTGLTATAVHSADPALVERAEGWMQGLTPGWMPNRGQVAASNGRRAADILYSLRAPGSQLHVTRRGLTTFFLASRDRDQNDAHGENEDRDRPSAPDWSALEIELVGATVDPARALPEGRIEALGEQHFYAPHCPEGVLGVPSYERITFRDVYPGIDWVLTANRGGAMHQDFVVRPGGDPNRIRLRYRGARELRLDDAGHTLHMRTALGAVSEGPLHCHQGADSSRVPARLRLDGDVVSVALGRWDRTAPLTIDPPLLWSTLYGGGNYDGPKSIYCDNLNGDVYVVGYTASADLPCSTAVAPLAYFQGTGSPAVPPDAFIWKFSQQGARQWATYYSGDSSDYAVDCTVDRLGNLYVTGNTASSNFPTQQLAGAYWQPVKAGSIDAYLLRFDSQGVRQWATYYGGDGNDFGTGVTTDSTDQVYVTGYTGSTNLNLVNPGSAYFQSGLNGSSDSFILKFNTLGALVWGTYHGGDSGEQALGLAVSASDLYVVGLTYSTVFPTVDPPGNSDYFQPANGGMQDAFISRFTLAGAQTWSTFYGGSMFDELRRPAITPSGDVYIDGLSNSTDLPVFNPNPVATPNQPAYFQGTNAGQFDVVLLRFTTANVRTWATYFGGSNSEDLGRGARSLTVDSQGRAYVTGTSGSNDLPLANPGGGAYYQTTTSGSDVFYARFTTTDSLEWRTFFGGGGASFGTAVAIGVNDCLFGTGEFQGTVFNTPPVNPPGANAWFRTTNSGNDDGFVTKFCLKPSACCIDFTCIGVTTAAECAALGGTAFHANQTCAQTNCSILCTICGRKFSDLNRNGIQDGGEPGLAGWTIELRNPAGAIVATAITAANGDYCFNNVGCGPWLVTEATQVGWVKIAPSGAGHSVSLPVGATQNGTDFGNYACPTAPPCHPVPPGLSAWWPFDDGPGATTAMDVTHAGTSRNRATLIGAASSGAGALCLAAPTDYATVPAAEQSGFAFGAGSFGVSVWILPDASTASGRVIVEQRGLTSEGTLAGWTLHLDEMHCMLTLATGSAPQLVAGPSLPAGVWSHVAVSVDRASGAGRWYLNGSPVATADFTPVSGSLDNTAALFIGQSDPSSGVTGPGLQGCLAQLGVFHTPISADMAAKAYGPGPGTGVPVAWCPDYAVLPASRTICSSQTSVQVCFAIGNASAVPVTYSWSLAGLPAGPGCTNPGPTQFSPSAGTVTVPAGGVSASICVTVTRPNGFTQQGATACYALTFVNHTTGVCRTRTSKLKVDNSCWCATANPTAIAMVPPGGSVVPFGIRRPCDPISTLAYRVVPRDPITGSPDASFVSLEGMAPGTPLAGTLSAGNGSEAELSVHVYFPGGYDAAATQELVLEADTDGDGTWEALASTFVSPTPDSDGTTDVGDDAAIAPVRLTPSPNPFVGHSTLAFTLAEAGPVSLAVYDFSGRLVRSLASGWLPPGPRRVAWDGRDHDGRRVAPGVYFARLRTRSGTQEARLVKVQ